MYHQIKPFQEHHVSYLHGNLLQFQKFFIHFAKLAKVNHGTQAEGPIIRLFKPIDSIFPENLRLKYSHPVEIEIRRG
jgi:hypothetical protein